MQIILNGKKHELTGPVSIADIIKSLGIDDGRVVVELNATIIRKELYFGTMLREGDTVEMVRLVGGG